MHVDPGLVEPIQCPQDIAQVVVQLGRVRFQTHRFLAVGQGLLGLAARQEHLAEVRAGGGIGRLELDGAAEMLQRLVELPQLAERQPQVVVGDDEPRPQRHGPTERLDRLGMALHRGQRGPQAAQGLGIVRPEPQRGATALRGSLVIPGGPVGLRQVAAEEMRVRPEGHGTTDQLHRSGRDRRPDGAACRTSAAPRRSPARSPARRGTATPLHPAGPTGGAPSHPQQLYAWRETQQPRDRSLPGGHRPVADPSRPRYRSARVVSRPARRIEMALDRGPGNPLS